MSRPVVAIVGRPNVGKSALFNRITGRRIAIVEGEPGVTRDRIYADTDWAGTPFTLVDTGGVEFTPSHDFSAQIREQVEIALAEADLILFVVDARSGLTPDDREIAQLLRRSRKPVILAANKVDEERLTHETAEFYALGLDPPIPVSAEHGRGVGDLLDQLIAMLPHAPEAAEEAEEIKVAVVGRPNVGKSSLVNRLLGAERSIVSDIPGTTRDALDTVVERDGTRFVLIDTAGIRRKSRIDEEIERYSVARAFQAIDRADVVFVMIDATELVTEQDQRIAGYAHEAGKGIVLVVNKWDLIVKDEKSMKRFEEQIKEALKFLTYAPIIFISALQGQRVHQLFELAVYVANQHALRVSTGRLNRALQEALARRQPPSDKGVRLRIFYMTQTQVKPPTFLLFVNRAGLMHYSYQRYLENHLRDSFGFVGTPIRFRLRERADGGGRSDLSGGDRRMRGRT